MGNDTAPVAAGEHVSAPRGARTRGRLESPVERPTWRSTARAPRTGSVPASTSRSIGHRGRRPGVAARRRWGGRPALGPAAVGRGRRWVWLATTPETAQAPDRYEIGIASGAAHLEISAEEGG
jgi:hypothetical protein